MKIKSASDYTTFNNIPVGSVFTLRESNVLYMKTLLPNGSNGAVELGTGTSYELYRALYVIPVNGYFTREIIECKKPTWISDAEEGT